MILLRRLLGDVLRRQRQRQGRTLREVSSSARVSLGYLSEVERGQKEASSELLAAICDALDVRMSVLMREVSDELALAELASAEAMRPVLEPVGAGFTPNERAAAERQTNDRSTGPGPISAENSVSVVVAA
jgi:XRE family transcriptional regulator, stress-response regulator